MKLAAIALVASAATTGLTIVPASAAGPDVKVVPTSCSAALKQVLLRPGQTPRIMYRAVAPVGYGTVTGVLRMTVSTNGAIVRTTNWRYRGESQALYRLAPFAPGRYLVTMSLMTARRSNLHNCSTTASFVVARRPTYLPQVMGGLGSDNWPGHRPESRSASRD